MSQRLGNGYVSSQGVETSTANQEIIPVQPGSDNNYNLYKFSFLNKTGSTYATINETDTIFIHEGLGFEVSEVDAPIFSFKIHSADVEFLWIGAFTNI